MENEARAPRKEYRPRLIIWQLTAGEFTRTFTTHECLLTIDSIARTSKSIVVLTGAHLMKRSDLYEILSYGTALGLKMIVEARPQELTPEVLRQYNRFGAKVFRVLLDGDVVEDMATRYKQSKAFSALEETVSRLREAGYELHFGVTVQVADLDLRGLAFKHDFAVRRSANGLYCHLCYKLPQKKAAKGAVNGLHEVIGAIAKMKRFSPKNMYVSPQCVRYGVREESPPDGEAAEDHAKKTDSEWMHLCLAGKTFAYIDPEGKVQMCIGLPAVCGDLRANGYDFEEVWEHSPTFLRIRAQELSCNNTRSEILARGHTATRKHT
jgi:MoaA/NifB/PqqE/SkfB family radical SAM enzyme